MFGRALTGNVKRTKGTNMLNAAELNAVVQSGVGDGVQLAILLETNGTVLSSAFACSKKEREEAYARVVAAAINIWRLYGRNDLTINQISLEEESNALEQVLMDWGEQKLCAMAVADKAIICLLANDAAVQVGRLKVKTMQLQRELDAILRPVMVESRT
ncbi:unnamed protein product [Phytomonas sp. Hart1]|nr:unnamed protein product [Phytomonas sp. Hart1]|eukprot:CCW68952.1 unnamed protein product [Phytomonas sp. isolate Hart1]